MTIAKTAENRSGRRPLAKFSQVSGANAAQTCQTDGLKNYRVLLVTVTVSGAVGADLTCTATINSLLGAAYDCLVGSAVVLDTTTMIVWQPTRPVDVGVGDSLDFLAPAMGGALTSAVVIYAEEL